MFERLADRIRRLAEARRLATIERLAARDTPPGVDVAAASEGLVLSGRKLRRRMIDDAALRSIAR